MEMVQLQANSEKQMQTLYNKWVFVPALLTFVIAVAVVCSIMSVHPFITVFAASSALLVLYYFIASRLFFSYMKKSAMSMVRYYMIHFFLRFIIGGIIIVAGAYILSNNVSKAFILSFCALFMVMLVCESLVFVKLEKLLNRKSE